ncbi:hypothetical protein EGI32_08350 [Ferruginibacter sp. HRS2-29]|nr:hypothetical protein [Ferruginibacter sp. HRS2-29]
MFIKKIVIPVHFKRGAKVMFFCLKTTINPDLKAGQQISGGSLPDNKEGPQAPFILKMILYPA